MDRHPTPQGDPARYTVTRLLVPEPVPPRRILTWRRGAAVLAVLLLAGISTALPGGSVVGALPEAAPPASRPAAAEGEWLTLVRAGLRDAPRPPGWSLEPTPEPAAPAALQPLGGAPWRTPEPLRRVLDTSARAASVARLAEAGGATQHTARHVPPWLWSSMDLPEVPLTRLTVTLPPALGGTSLASGTAASIGGISYADPLGVGLPLLQVRGFEAFPVSAHFTVADFATRDGAPYARISPDLVTTLERMRAILGPLEVISGYRHPQYNALASVGGARYSRHQTGEAADLWSPTRSSLEIAAAAVQAAGCGIGLGLGRNTVHVDVRGYLKTWTYPGAPLGDDAFRRWIVGLCDGDVPAPPPPHARPYDASWLAMAEGTMEDDEETVHLGDGTPDGLVPEAASPSPEATPEARPSMSAVIQRDLAAYAAAAHVQQGAGVVVVDLRDGAYLTGEALLARSRYVGAATPEVRALDVRPLLDVVARRSPGRLFVYVVRHSDGQVETGVASTAAVAASPVASAPPPAPEAVAPAERWLLRLSSRSSFAGAEADLARYTPSLARAGIEPSIRVSRVEGGVVFEVVAGPFTSADAAAEVQARADALLPTPSRLIRAD
ncbi:MAG: D-Ala-D-Ala carboxypeptidase family metallohydrolase [Bacteroidota bacterium]